MSDGPDADWTASGRDLPRRHPNQIRALRFRKHNEHRGNLPGASVGAANARATCLVSRSPCVAAQPSAPWAQLGADSKRGGHRAVITLALQTDIKILDMAGSGSSDGTHWW
jgi:hypothetical protein